MTTRSIAAISGTVSRETIVRLEAYVDALALWSKRINLIGPGTADEIWQRHVLDSLQILQLAPDARRWVDFGTGAGLPGMVIACAKGDNPEFEMTLVESNRKKTAFLKSIRPTIAPRVQISEERIEAFVIDHPAPDVVTARAVAALDVIFEWMEPWLAARPTFLFPKGRGYRKELQDTATQWRYDCKIHPSAIDQESVVLEIRNLARA